LIGVNLNVHDFVISEY